MNKKIIVSIILGSFFLSIQLDAMKRKRDDQDVPPNGNLVSRRMPIALPFPPLQTPPPAVPIPKKEMIDGLKSIVALLEEMQCTLSSITLPKE
jgi:hypothetical protein